MPLYAYVKYARVPPIRTICTWREEGHEHVWCMAIMMYHGSVLTYTNICQVTYQPYTLSGHDSNCNTYMHPPLFRVYRMGRHWGLGVMSCMTKAYELTPERSLDEL